MMTWCQHGIGSSSPTIYNACRRPVPADDESTHMEVPMRLCELLAAVSDVPDIRSEANPQLLAITDDSRQVAAGTLFVAVRGEKHDGHRFIAAACAAGAAAVVAERPIAMPAGIPTVRVEDSRRFLARAAAVWTGLRDIQERG